jgi:DHA2 family multidrug resistance protein-like MFS transporter
MNDLLRQLGGALGVAVIGSVMNTIYRDRVADALTGLPPQAAGAARDPVGAAVAIAAQVGGAAGDALAAAARAAFVDGLGAAAVVAAFVAVLTSVYVTRQMPTRQTSEADSMMATPAPQSR